MKYLKVICKNSVNANPEVIKWNSWDGEHLASVHSAYSNPKTLYSAPNNLLFFDVIKIPYLPFKISSMVYTVQNSEFEQVSYTKNLFFLAKNSIKIYQKDKKSVVEVTYEFEANLLVSLLFPLIKKQIKKWNKTVWKEDLPLKMRRQKALEYGFIDWVGIPNKKSDRVDKSIDYKTEIPVYRPKGLEQDSHPFCIIKKK
jgi:hypothetical protein